MGYRNPCDFALNRDGEMFVYDADMEWDMGAPWYRPTRINHGVSGGRTDGGPLLRNGESIFRYRRLSSRHRPRLPDRGNCRIQSQLPNPLSRRNFFM